MRSKPILFSLSVLVVSLHSCIKKNKIETPNPAIPINKEFIITGDSLHMAVKPLNTTILFSKGQAVNSRDFDLNSDGVIDLTLNYLIGGTPVRQFMYIYAKSRNSALLAATLRTDTTFIKKWQTNAIVQDTIPFVGNFTTTSCKRSSAEDSILSIKNLVAHAPSFIDGSIVEMLSAFASDSLPLYRDDYVESSVTLKNDTLIGTTRTYEYACDNKTLNKPFYLVCRIIDKGETKLAWLKLNIVGHGNIFLYNTAVPNW